MIREPQLRQVGALPWRRARTVTEIFLITSRETKRWVIPKGWAMEGLPDHGAAAREAFEEAGVEGVTAPGPIGHFDYDKLGKARLPLRIRVDVYALEVLSAARDWPEKLERSRAWFPADDAASRVAEADLATLIRRFAGV